MLHRSRSTAVCASVRSLLTYYSGPVIYFISFVCSLTGHMIFFLWGWGMHLNCWIQSVNEHWKVSVVMLSGWFICDAPSCTSLTTRLKLTVEKIKSSHGFSALWAWITSVLWHTVGDTGFSWLYCYITDSPDGISTENLFKITEIHFKLYLISRCFQRCQICLARFHKTHLKWHIRQFYHFK